MDHLSSSSGGAALSADLLRSACGPFGGIWPGLLPDPEVLGEVNEPMQVFRTSVLFMHSLFVHGASVGLS
jgi:hypothetical protein